jgi:SAM-dependent methyltransferase
VSVRRSAAPPPESVHRIPREARLVDRESFITTLVRGKDVADLGFVDSGRFDGRLEHGDWLHAAIAREARHVVGIDADPVGVRAAAELGYEARVGDCEDSESLERLQLDRVDVIVAGELVEHLANPGRFLAASAVLLRPGGCLVLTTPNATSLTNSLASLLNRELVNAEHVLWLSWRTGVTLLHRHGWTVTQVAYYALPPFRAEGLSRAHHRRVRAMNAYQSVARVLFRARPALSDGIIFVAVRSQNV